MKEREAGGGGKRRETTVQRASDKQGRVGRRRLVVWPRFDGRRPWWTTGTDGLGGWGEGVATRLQVSLFTTLYLSFGVEEQGSPSHQDKDFMAV